MLTIPTLSSLARLLLVVETKFDLFRKAESQAHKMDVSHEMLPRLVGQFYFSGKYPTYGQLTSFPSY